MTVAPVSRRQEVEHMVAERERTGQGTATVERIMQAGDSYDVTATGVTQIIRGNGLDQMLRLKLISEWEFAAGDEYRRDAALARIDPGPSTVDWQSVGANFGPKTPAEYSSQAIHDARDRWRKAEDALRGAGGADLKDLLIVQNVCLDDWGPLWVGKIINGRRHRRDAAVSGVDTIKMALQRLAAHYENGRRRFPKKTGTMFT